MTNTEIREALRQALTDWQAATPEQREQAIEIAAKRAEAATR